MKAACFQYTFLCSTMEPKASREDSVCPRFHVLGTASLRFEVLQQPLGITACISQATVLVLRAAFWASNRSNPNGQSRLFLAIGLLASPGEAGKFPLSSVYRGDDAGSPKVDALAGTRDQWTLQCISGALRTSSKHLNGLCPPTTESVPKHAAACLCLGSIAVLGGRHCRVPPTEIRCFSEDLGAHAWVTKGSARCVRVCVCVSFLVRRNGTGALIKVIFVGCPLCSWLDWAGCFRVTVGQGADGPLFFVYRHPPC